MRGWIVLHALTGAGSIAAVSAGGTSLGVKSLCVMTVSLAVLSILSTLVRGRA